MNNLPKWEDTQEILPSWDQTEEIKPEGPGGWESAGLGAAQGATFGFGDEGSAVLEWLIGKISGNEAYKDATYTQLRDEYRKENAAAKEAHPLIYGASEIAGSVPALIATGGIGGTPATLGQAAKIGAIGGGILGGVSGLGAAEGDIKQQALQTIIGTGLGAGLGTAGYGVSYGVSKLFSPRVAARQAAKAYGATEDFLLANQGELGIRGGAIEGAQENIGRQVLEDELLSPFGSDINKLSRLQNRMQPPSIGPNIGPQPERIPINQTVGIDRERRMAELALQQKIQQPHNQPISSIITSIFLREGIGGAVGGYIGHETGIGTTAGALAGMGLAAGAKRYGPQMNALLVDTITKKLGRFAPMLEQAAQRGPQAFAVTYNLLSQQYPEFRQSAKEIEEGINNPSPEEGNNEQ
jgi:hypothetical protein